SDAEPMAAKAAGNQKALQTVDVRDDRQHVRRSFDQTTPGFDERRFRDLRKPPIERSAHFCENLLLRRWIEHSFALEGRGYIEVPAAGCRQGLEKLKPKLQAQRPLALAECGKELGCEPEGGRRQRMLKRSAVCHCVPAIGSATD